MGPICIRTEKVKEEIAIRYTSYIGRKISMQKGKSVLAFVAMVFECYLFITSSCIV